MPSQLPQIPPPVKPGQPLVTPPTREPLKPIGLGIPAGVKNFFSSLFHAPPPPPVQRAPIMEGFDPMREMRRIATLSPAATSSASPSKPSEIIAPPAREPLQPVGIPTGVRKFFSRLNRIPQSSAPPSSPPMSVAPPFSPAPPASPLMSVAPPFSPAPPASSLMSVAPPFSPAPSAPPSSSPATPKPALQHIVPPPPPPRPGSPQYAQEVSRIYQENFGRQPTAEELQHHITYKTKLDHLRSWAASHPQRIGATTPSPATPSAAPIPETTAITPSSTPPSTTAPAPVTIDVPTTAAEIRRIYQENFGRQPTEAELRDQIQAIETRGLTVDAIESWARSHPENIAITGKVSPPLTGEPLAPLPEKEGSFESYLKMLTSPLPAEAPGLKELQEALKAERERRIAEIEKSAKQGEEEIRGRFAAMGLSGSGLEEQAIRQYRDKIESQKTAAALPSSKEIQAQMEAIAQAQKTRLQQLGLIPKFLEEERILGREPLEKEKLGAQIEMLKGQIDLLPIKAQRELAEAEKALIEAQYAPSKAEADIALKRAQAAYSRARASAPATAKVPQIPISIMQALGLPVTAYKRPMTELTQETPPDWFRRQKEEEVGQSLAPDALKSEWDIFRAQAATTPMPQKPMSLDQLALVASQLRALGASEDEVQKVIGGYIPPT